MKWTVWFLLIAAVGNALYHLGQKSLHDVAVNPLLILCVYYVLAGVLCVVAMPFFGKVEWASVTALASNGRVWLVALGILLIELGFLLAYQSGGSVQWSGVAVVREESPVHPMVVERKILIMAVPILSL